MLWNRHRTDLALPLLALELQTHRLQTDHHFLQTDSRAAVVVSALAAQVQVRALLLEHQLQVPARLDVGVAELAL